MGTNGVTESLCHNESLFDLSLEREKSNGKVFGYLFKIFKFYVHTFCVEISGHGSECRSSERPKLALVQPIT